ncbi:ABC-type organic anion transporter ABCA8-like [Emys orbicularis]|uniref:ABC-type organic anion transporter ABCA8-like n=1 Tax=Emys orbicularis TaxID=82168 RepID=UPI0031FBA804
MATGEDEDDDEMLPRRQREISVCQQTGALLLKHILVKWRKKKQSLQELLLSLLIPLILYLNIISGWYRRFPAIPSDDLGRVDEFNANTFGVQYTPVTHTTTQIMQHMASVSFLKGLHIFENNTEEQSANMTFYDTIEVNFNDAFSYELASHPYSSFHLQRDNMDHHSDSCSGSIFYDDVTCAVTQQWTSGFVPLQANIDAAIIQIASNHSVMEELRSVTAVQMRLPPIRVAEGINYDFLVVCTAVAFSPLIYFMSLNVAKERRKFKELMKMMALQDLAFWFSWGLLYAGYILIVAILLTLIMKSDEFIYHTSHSVMFFLFYLYGISLMSLAFLLSSLLKKPKLTGIVGFLFILSFGSLGLAVLYNHVPEPLEWALGLFSPFAFTAGFVRIVHLEDAVKGVDFSDFLEDSFPMLAIFFLLAFDALLYLMLAIYFDKVLPDKYGMHHSRLFFLKPSYWFKKRKNCVNNDILDHEEYSDQVFNDHVEQVPPEFHGKEAISINNIKKMYKDKDKIVNALRGLLLNVYEGQITALLGHSGAGKSTLLNILSGLCPPSEGSAMIYKYKVSEMEDLEEIRKIIGVCPQFNIQFEVLTVKENLRIFAKIKGIRLKEVEQEVQNVLTMLKIKDIQDCQASNLSGGQKRKLTLGIAILGDPQVLILDEPTAGLDLSSRYHVWSLLKEHKANRVTLFSTQLTDEADIIADRKAFISHGRLKCVGSSLFLKRKWGIGYHLSLHINDSCDSAKMTSLVQQHIPNAKLSGQSHEELIYMLPFENVDKFPELFCDLDTHACQEILSYGISMTTLADVFLTLEEEAAIDQADYGVFSEEQAEEERDAFSPDELEQSLLSLSDTGKATVRGTALWRQQVCALARIRFLKLKHESQTIRSILLVCGLLILPCLISKILIGGGTVALARKVSPQMYFLQPGQQHYRTRHTSLLVLNDTGSDIEDFIHAVKSQNIMLEVANGKSISDGQEYNGAIKVSLVDKHFRFSMMCHAKRINCFPVLMNIISNALLRNLNSTRRIQVSTRMLPMILNGHGLRLLWHSIIFMSVLASGFAPHFAMSSIGDYKIKAHSQLWTSGMLPSAYWCGQALVDIPLCCVLLFTMTGIMFLISYQASLTPGLLALPLVVSIFGYAASIVVLTYVISFAFRKRKSYSDLWAFIFIFVSIYGSGGGVSFVLNGIYYITHVDFITTILTALIPIYTLAGCIRIIVQVSSDHEFFSWAEDEEMMLSRVHLLASLAPYLHCIIFIFILRCLEWKYGRKTTREDPIFRISPRKEMFHQNPEESEGEDEDVQAERMKARSVMTCQNQEERPILSVNSLRKEYKDKKASSIFKKRKKVATKNVSFCVKKGEVFGLLGPNGAGKSTTLKVIIGDTSLTAGQVVMKGADAAASEPEEDTTDFLGYCPQENPLWPNLTVQEHLEVYAAVKGMTKEDAAVTIKRVVNALKLQEHLQKPAKKLPAGISRKVCFALSMLGKPTLVLLDELSTGMDPMGQHHVWTAVRAALKNKKQGVILTTHYMKEAEALCDRVAIMVSGKLRCIGSIQYLKNKFGKGYLLEIKVKDPEQVDLIHAEITQIFPLAARQERYSSLMVYKIPMENVQSLSQAFFNLEAAKRTFDLEEYSLSQSTLEQVFLELSREQEKEDFDMNLDSTAEWKLLQKDDN